MIWINNLWESASASYKQTPKKKKYVYENGIWLRVWNETKEGGKRENKASIWSYSDMHGVKEEHFPFW